MTSIELYRHRAFIDRKPIKGYEGHYSVTEDGRIWSEERIVINKRGAHLRRGSQWLKPFDLGDSYLRVNLRLPGHIKMFCIHWLVARTFIIDPKNGMEIDHIDRNCRNNHVSNLRYVTKTKNVLNRDAKGCYFRKDRGRWQAQLRWGDNRIILGQFKTEEEAHAAYVAAKKELLLTLK